MSFKYAELFGGILGFGTALDELGGEPVFISEIDRHAQEAIRALGRGDVLHGDITEIAAEDVPSHDLLVGGFPCQAFSVAGKRLGLEDMRGTLFFEVVRIAKFHKPRAILLENVKGLLSHADGDTISAMLHALNDVGYLIDISLLNSKYFDVPQHRERVYICAVREDLAEPEEWIGGKGGVLQSTKRRLQEEGLVTFNFDWSHTKVVRKRLKDILEPEPDEKYYLPDRKAAALIAKLKAEPPIVPEGSRPFMVGSLEYYGNDQMNRVYSIEAISPSLTVVSGGGREKKILVVMPDGSYRVRALTPRETWRLQSFEDETFDRVQAAGISKTQLYRQAGNAVTVNIIRAVAPKLLPYLY